MILWPDPNPSDTAGIHQLGRQLTVRTNVCFTENQIRTFFGKSSDTRGDAVHGVGC